MNTERDFDIALLEVQEANDKLIADWKKQKLGKRGPDGNTEFGGEDQLANTGAGIPAGPEAPAY